MATKAVAKKKKKNGTTIPIAIVAPLVAEGVERVIDIQDGNATLALDRLTQHYTGYSPSLNDWKWERLKGGAIPLAIGVIVHKVAQKLGVNRAIASAGVPWIRV